MRAEMEVDAANRAAFIKRLEQVLETCPELNHIVTCLESVRAGCDLKEFGF